jgi:hypothetical protein
MASPRSLYVLAGAIAGLGSALWLNAIAPLAGLIAASWGALMIVHALAVAVTAVLAMLLTAAGALLAADWRADFQDRQAWAQLGPTAVELSLPVDTATPREIDPRYLPGVDNEALLRVFRAHRFASLAPALQTVPELPAALHATRLVVASAKALPALTIRDAGPEITCSQEISSTVVSEVDISGRALRKLGSTMPADASIAVASSRRLPLALRAGRAAQRTRLVANAKAWAGWPARNERFQAWTLPCRHAADIVVLGSSRDDRPQPVPDASTGGNIASSTEPPNCRGPPQVVAHRSRATEATPAKLSVKSARRGPVAGALPSADPVVRDNLGHHVPVCAAELDVIETYLDHVLRDLLASSTAGPEKEEA